MESNLKNLNGADVAKGIEISEHGAISMTGEGINFLRLVYLKQALVIQGHGMKLSRHLPAGTTMARRMLGIKGNRESLLRQVAAIIERVQLERARAKQEAP